MFGIVYFLLIAGYLWLIHKSVRFAWMLGREGHGSLVQGALYACVALFGVTLPITWNVVPVYAEFSANCHRDAGFVEVYPADRWVAENHARIPSTKELEVKRGATEYLPDGSTRSVHFNGMIAFESKDSSKSHFGLTIYRQETRLVDVRRNTTIASAVDYQAGSAEDLRFWLRQETCFRGGQRPRLMLHVYFKRLVEKAQ
jgi:hypothetical protein